MAVGKGTLNKVMLIVAHGGQYDKPNLAMEDEEEGIVKVYLKTFKKVLLKYHGTGASFLTVIFT